MPGLSDINILDIAPWKSCFLNRRKAGSSVYFFAAVGSVQFKFIDDEVDNVDTYLWE